MAHQLAQSGRSRHHARRSNPSPPRRNDALRVSLKGHSPGSWLVSLATAELPPTRPPPLQPNSHATPRQILAPSSSSSCAWRGLQAPHIGDLLPHRALHRHHHRRLLLLRPRRPEAGARRARLAPPGHAHQRRRRRSFQEHQEEEGDGEEEAAGARELARRRRRRQPGGRRPELAEVRPEGDSWSQAPKVSKSDEEEIYR
ncbi:hypothetical protein PVAP13_2KG288068 [Panicum virgatum]|uniref:Uncharacterized protein n=1 Tax=Panicum virgatum TaxID=38727 RepID=A0A8T0WIB5_PANVG|nr:hypothetical protein PVAP13_2KG288068 [Panicum virgatum]